MMIALTIVLVLLVLVLTLLLIEWNRYKKSNAALQEAYDNYIEVLEQCVDWYRNRSWELMDKLYGTGQPTDSYVESMTEEKEG